MSNTDKASIQMSFFQNAERQFSRMSNENTMGKTIKKNVWLHHFATLSWIKRLNALFSFLKNPRLRFLLSRLKTSESRLVFV